MVLLAQGWPCIRPKVGRSVPMGFHVFVLLQVTTYEIGGLEERLVVLFVCAKRHTFM